MTEELREKLANIVFQDFFTNSEGEKCIEIPIICRIPSKEELDKQEKEFRDFIKTSAASIALKTEDRSEHT